MFTVQPARLSEEAQKLENLALKLDRMKSMLNRTGSALTDNLETEAAKDLIVSIKRLEGNLLTHTQEMSLMAKTLDNVSLIYRQCEKRITAEAQEISLMHRNVSAQINDLSWYSEKLSELNFR